MTPRAKRPPTKPPPVPSRALEPRDSQEEVPTAIFEPNRPESPTRIERPKPGSGPKQAPAPAIQAISMKTPGADKLAVDAMRAEPMLKRPVLRQMAEVTPPSGVPAVNLGFIAPPRDPAEVRGRRVRELMIMSSLSIIIASVVALVIWFLAK